jgi:hypothetical protein
MKNDIKDMLPILEKIDKNTAVLAKFEKAMAAASRKYPVKPMARIGTGNAAYLPIGESPRALRNQYGRNSFSPGHTPVTGRAEKVRPAGHLTATRQRDEKGRFTKAVQDGKTGTMAAERRADGSRPVSQSGTTPAIQQSRSMDLLNQRRVKKQNTWLAGAIGKAVAKAGGFLSKAKDFISAGAPTSATDAAGMAAGGPFWAAAKELADAAGTTKDNRFLKAGFDKIAGAFGGKKAEKAKSDKRDDQGRFLKAVQPGKKSILKDVRDHEQAEKTTEAIERVIDAIEKADKADAKRSTRLVSAARGGADGGGVGAIGGAVGLFGLKKLKDWGAKLFGKGGAEVGAKVLGKGGIGRKILGGAAGLLGAGLAPKAFGLAKGAGGLLGKIPGVKTAAAAVGGVGAKVVSSIAQAPIVKSVSKAVGESAIVQGAKSVGKSGMEMLGKGGSKGVEKGGAKALEKTAGKSLLKKIPGVGLAIGGALAVDRAIDGDLVGATGELASGLASLVPGVGTIASLAIDGLLIARDLMREGKNGGDMPIAAGGKTAAADMEAFQNMGWTKEQAAGIAANIQAESGGDPKALGDGGKAYGLAQWHPDRQEDFRKWSGKDIRESSRDEQLQFVDYELRHGKEQKAGRMLATATTEAQAGRIVSDEYERPRDPTGAKARHRGAWAENIVSSATLAKKEEIAKAEATVTGPMAVSANTVTVGAVSESTGAQAKTVGAMKPVSPLPAVKQEFQR